jgi:hypothetical protein
MHSNGAQPAKARANPPARAGDKIGGTEYSGRMAYELTLEEHPRYLHATVTGIRSARNAARFLREVHEACKSRGISAVLMEFRFSGPSLDTGSIYSVIAERSEDARDLRKIAYVDETESDPEKPKFAETVAVNRGVNVRLFRSVEEAKRWISK